MILTKALFSNSSLSKKHLIRIFIILLFSSPFFWSPLFFKNPSPPSLEFRFSNYFNESSIVRISDFRRDNKALTKLFFNKGSYFIKDSLGTLKYIKPSFYFQSPPPKSNLPPYTGMIPLTLLPFCLYGIYKSIIQNNKTPIFLLAASALPPFFFQTYYFFFPAALIYLYFAAYTFVKIPKTFYYIFLHLAFCIYLFCRSFLL